MRALNAGKGVSNRREPVETNFERAAVQQASLLRQPAVVQRTGVRKTAMYQAIKAGEFPAPVKLTGRAVAWVSTEIDAWIASRPKVSA